MMITIIIIIILPLVMNDKGFSFGYCRFVGKSNTLIYLQKQNPQQSFQRKMNGIELVHKIKLLVCVNSLYLFKWNWISITFFSTEATRMLSLYRTLQQNFCFVHVFWFNMLLQCTMGTSIVSLKPSDSILITRFSKRGEVSNLLKTRTN